MKVTLPMLSIGDQVKSRYGLAKVERIEIVIYSDFSGPAVESVPWCKVDGEIVVDLSNGHWCLGFDIEPAA